MLPLKKSERIQIMKMEFMKYYKRNWTVERIAAYFAISKPSIFKHLEEIATENGLTREEMISHFKSIRY